MIQRIKKLSTVSPRDQLHAIRIMKAGMLLLLMAGFISSCYPKSTPPGANNVSGSVGHTLYWYHHWQEGLAILVWHDFSYGESNCGGSSSTEDPLYRINCTVKAGDGRQFSWEIHSSDGLTADMWIEGQKFDLSQGTMFLVGSRDNKLELVQLQKDFSALAPSHETVSALAITDDDIANFVTNAKVDEDAVHDTNDGLVEFLNSLRAAGYSVELTTRIIQPFFSAPGQTVVIEGEGVQVFEYPDSPSAKSEAALISPDAASVGNTRVAWAAPPHFYVQERLIALYVGENDAVIGILNQLLGEPIAQWQSIMALSQPEPTAEPALSFETVTYRNKTNGFEFDYPATWTFQEDVLGDRGSGAQFYSEGEFTLSAIVYLWDPKNDLDAYVGRWRQVWATSGLLILSEAELTLVDGRRAVQFEIEELGGWQKYVLFTKVGDRYLQLSGTGDLNLLAEIAQTLRPLAS